MRLFKQLLIAGVVFIVSVLVCAMGGGLLGKFIAAQFPTYSPTVFSAAATQRSFDPNEMGIATGVGQGAAAGLFVGAVVLIALAIGNWRREQRG